MDIWEILGIEPTTDKKIIKKAYAAKTKEIHPEEKPEEFKVLYEAYQTALGWADHYLRIERIEAETGRPNKSSYELADELYTKRMETETAGTNETSEESGTNHTEETVGEEYEAMRAAETTGEAELLSYFTENQEKHQQSVEAFLNYWKAFQSPYHNPEVLDWWKKYLASEEFQDIRYHPQVLHLLAEEINDKFFYGINEVKLLFWDAYGFREDEENAYQGEQQRLWNCLYPAYVKQQNHIRNEKRQSKYEKVLRIFLGVAITAIVFLCIMVPVSMHIRRENGRLYLIDYMAEQYPNTEFSEPERLEKLNDGNAVYTLHAVAHPELEITAKVQYQYLEGEKTYLVTEDYCQLLLGYYATEYGLEAGQLTYQNDVYRYPEENVYNVLFYPDIEQIDSFSDTVEKMFHEQEELQKLSEIAVCTQSVLFPEVLVHGGVEFFPFSDPQVYDLSNMDAAALASAVREAYMIYMFQYESWNITSAQYREWGADYEKICEQWEDDKGDWHEVYDPDTGEYLCRLFIPTYEYHDSYLPVPTRKITVGSAYYFLLDRGADLSVHKGGSGFRVEFYGDITNFGEEPEENFYELQHYY